MHHTPSQQPILPTYMPYTKFVYVVDFNPVSVSWRDLSQADVPDVPLLRNVSWTSSATSPDGFDSCEPAQVRLGQRFEVRRFRFGTWPPGRQWGEMWKVVDMAIHTLWMLVLELPSTEVRIYLGIVKTREGEVSGHRWFYRSRVLQDFDLQRVIHKERESREGPALSGAFPFKKPAAIRSGDDSYSYDMLRHADRASGRASCCVK